MHPDSYSAARSLLRRRAAAQPRRPFQENWWNRLGGNPAELSKVERAFQIAAEQGSSAVDLEVFSHCIIAVATEGWIEQRNPVSGRVWFENPETGEVSNERPGADCVEPYLQRAGLRMASVRGLAQASRAALRLSRGSAAMNPLASPPPPCACADWAGFRCCALIGCSTWPCASKI